MTETSSPESSKTPLARADTGKKPLNFLLVVAVVVAVSLFIWAEQNRRSTARQLADTTNQLAEIQASSQQSADAVADEILEKVNDLVDIPLEPRPAVAKISDIDRLKAENDFFNVADNGDYLILTGNRALLYDPDRNIVLDVAPFQIKNESPVPSPASRN